MIILVDADHLFSRNFHALIDYTGVQGQPAGGIFGFIRSINSICRQLVPYYLVLCWGDKRSNLWRKQIYPEYKAHRSQAPDSFHEQRAITQEIFCSAGLSQTMCPTFEADDVLAALAKDCAEGGREVGIVTGDHDMFQLVDSRIRVYVPLKGSKFKKMDEAAVEEKMGLPPKMLPQFMALKGEKGDGVPGITGIGKVWARKYLLGTASPEVIKKIEAEQELIARNLKLVSLLEITAKELTPSELPLMPKPYQEKKVLAALIKAGLTGSKTVINNIRSSIALYQEIQKRGAVPMEELIK